MLPVTANQSKWPATVVDAKHVLVSFRGNAELRRTMEPSIPAADAYANMGLDDNQAAWAQGNRRFHKQLIFLSWGNGSALYRCPIAAERWNLITQMACEHPHGSRALRLQLLALGEALARVRGSGRRTALSCA